MWKLVVTSAWRAVTHSVALPGQVSSAQNSKRPPVAPVRLSAAGRRTPKTRPVGHPAGPRAVPADLQPRGSSGSIADRRTNKSCGKNSAPRNNTRRPASPPGNQPGVRAPAPPRSSAGSSARAPSPFPGEPGPAPPCARPQLSPPGAGVGPAPARPLPAPLRNPPEPPGGGSGARRGRVRGGQRSRAASHLPAARRASPGASPCRETRGRCRAGRSEPR